MKNDQRGRYFGCTAIFIFASSTVFAENASEVSPAGYSGQAAWYFLIFLITLALLIFALRWLLRSTQQLTADERDLTGPPSAWLADHVNELDAEQIQKIVKRHPLRSDGSAGNPSGTALKVIAIFLITAFAAQAAKAQANADDNVSGSPGMIIMVVLTLIPLLFIIYLVAAKLSRLSKKVHQRKIRKDAKDLISFLAAEKDNGLLEDLEKRKKALDFHLNNRELSGDLVPEDKKGILKNVAAVNATRFIAPKRKAAKRHDINPELIQLILYFLGAATFWLVVGTSVGEYLGIKFVSPDVDHVSWLSFGRLRPVHTNIVFWGWSSQAMIGLGYYLVSTVSNAPIVSIKRGYISLALINAAVVSGSVLLMCGINNGGGEYREYIWPAMGLFAAGIVVTLINFIQTIARRRTREIYISNWYIIAALMFILVIVVVAYTPFWQNGLGETIVQGYYMHQAVGMWFMMFNLGLIYYFLPQQLNTPIYSYSLGVLAFWSQILFYTLIGTHHFLFSSIPWWLQTIAIVGSMGMLIPVFAGTTNFIMTFRGNYSKVATSYTLPFYVVGIVFYFTGSTQGTAEAFRSTNLVWHFTDFTVAHSHMTMYGIIAFILWACIYTLVPRLTGKEPRQSLVGAHFWMALIGLLFYSVPLMIGGTLRGMSWVAGKPFIDSVTLMAPYWLWRAIGGSLMWASHLIFAWNMYTMIGGKPQLTESEMVIEELAHLPVQALKQ
jgi:cytochrome c oxidase cbb3-type subunit 1